jgi:hypothetical protein
MVGVRVGVERVRQLGSLECEYDEQYPREGEGQGHDEFLPKR